MLSPFPPCRLTQYVSAPPSPLPLLPLIPIIPLLPSLPLPPIPHASDPLALTAYPTLALTTSAPYNGHLNPPVMGT